MEDCTCCRNVDEDGGDWWEALTGSGQDSKDLRRFGSIEDILCRIGVVHAVIYTSRPEFSIVVPSIGRDRTTCSNMHDDYLGSGVVTDALLTGMRSRETIDYTIQEHRER